MGTTDAGPFGEWVRHMQRALAGEGDMDVPCGECIACCTSGQLIPVEPDEEDTRAALPAGALGDQPAQAGQLFTMSVRAVGRLTEVEEFENVVVQTGPDGALVRVKDVGRVELGADPLLGEHLAAVRRAVEAGERLEVEYYSASRDELTTRRIDPEHLFMAAGHWYVVAWDDRSDEERMFRVDRLRAVSAVGETFEPRGLEGLGRPLYTRSDRDVTVRLRLGPGARWVAEYYEVERTTDGPDGTLDVTIPAKDLAWTTKLVLRLAGEAEVLDPPELREMVAEEARSALSRYAAD